MIAMQGKRLVVRDTVDGDIQGIVALFCENGSNPYRWSFEKWRHYYRQYPEGAPISMVAELDGKIVGHYGMLPVIIGGWSAMLGLHAYVAANQRDLTIVLALMKAADERCRATKAAFVCGFANPAFTYVKNKLFKWQTPFWLGFKKEMSLSDLKSREERRFIFNYSQKWVVWRFGAILPTYISRYTSADGLVKKQVLKTSVYTIEQDLRGCEGWSPALMFTKAPADRFCQPFSLKIFDSDLIGAGVLDPNNWFIEMGDSDTFQYSPWKVAT